MNRTTTTFHEGFEEIFNEIMKRRPDLNNKSEVAQQAVREMYDKIQTGNEHVTAEAELKALEIALKYASPIKQSEIVEHLMKKLSKKGKAMMEKALTEI